MLRFLHLALYDKKFFSSVKKQFDSDGRFKNQYIALVNKDAQINEQLDDCEFCTTFAQLKNVVQKYDYDYVFFHSLTPIFANVIFEIPREKIIIWWAWGFDLYSMEHILPPFIPIELYKPITKKQFYFRRNPLLTEAKSIFFWLLHSCNRNKIQRIIKRINYFQPVTQIEYLLLKKQYPFITAKEFYYPNSFGNNLPVKINKLSSGNSILLGNSATYTNNHLDVWNGIKEFVNNNQKIFIPTSYGDSAYAKKLKEIINTQSTVFLDKFLTREQYNKLMDECAFFIIGSLRQQAMGNVSICIEKGIKIFAYKDSIIYQALLSYGCFVFAIEDIDSTSFSIPLTIEQANHNIECYRSEKSRRDLLLEDFFRNENK